MTSLTTISVRIKAHTTGKSPVHHRQPFPMASMATRHPLETVNPAPQSRATMQKSTRKVMTIMRMRGLQKGSDVTEHPRIPSGNRSSNLRRGRRLARRAQHPTLRMVDANQGESTQFPSNTSREARKGLLDERFKTRKTRPRRKDQRHPSRTRAKHHRATQDETP